MNYIIIDKALYKINIIFSLDENKFIASFTCYDNTILSYGHALLQDAYFGIALLIKKKYG